MNDKKLDLETATAALDNVLGNGICHAPYCGVLRPDQGACVFPCDCGISAEAAQTELMALLSRIRELESLVAAANDLAAIARAHTETRTESVQWSDETWGEGDTFCDATEEDVQRLVKALDTYTALSKKASS